MHSRSKCQKFRTPIKTPCFDKFPPNSLQITLQGNKIVAIRRSMQLRIYGQTPSSGKMHRPIPYDLRSNILWMETTLHVQPVVNLHSFLADYSESLPKPGLLLNITRVYVRSGKSSPIHIKKFIRSKLSYLPCRKIGSQSSTLCFQTYKSIINKRKKFC